MILFRAGEPEPVGAGRFWLLGAGAGAGRSRVFGPLEPEPLKKKYQEPEPEPLGKNQEPVGSSGRFEMLSGRSKILFGPC